ncbi:nitrate- and nitrite sensing domain-containing protein [Umezawaea sp. Da 62-37]|uniref:sensor histidine kinase n=1 Tax=Umezawaea sp. Da 62-37 TaxID=3075927 RepID=UPI0028F74469|nr:nitrate- and nitrite sensing domain-containing protein [Umezawaea sp. Da 62-37]WNV84268.1 nitrate- and nitrite sensing domain-containing protein [Umezawaea sp. Da 62-37]
MTVQNRVRWRWATVADWRNWRLPVKVAAVLLVPVAVAVGAGVLQIRGYVVRADSYAAVGKLVTLRSAMTPLVTALQDERAYQAGRVDGAVPEPGAFHERAAVTTRALDNVRSIAADATLLSDVSESRYSEVLTQINGLPQLRQSIDAGSDVSVAVVSYTTVLRTLLDFDQALVNEFGDPALAGTGVALHNLSMAGEQLSQQHAVVLAAVSRGRLLDAEAVSLGQSTLRYQDRLTDFTALANSDQRAEWTRTVTGRDVLARERMVNDARASADTTGTGEPPSLASKVTAGEWESASHITDTLVGAVVVDLEGELASTASRLQDDTSDQAGLTSTILLASLLVAVGIGVVVGNNMIRSLLTLRRTALQVARHQLPALVADLREEGASEVVIEPVAVHTTEEFGQLARAFDAVHQQAVGSAVEQARLRGGLRNTFVNLSRRSQGLVERQLRLMEELERKEENPQQLANLFKLDHLATRMRRNNENLMVLSGTDVTRRFSKPIPLADVLRAAASEIEQYQRVVVQTTPQVEVVGYAASDLVRLIAELLDNATAFSPPRSHVVIVGRPRSGGGVVIDVIDEGVGMSGPELEAANERLRSVSTDELPASRQMGLFVIARLAVRHQVEVTLVDQGPHREGLRAVVGVPPDLVRQPAKEPPRVVDTRPAAARAAALPPSPRPRPATNGVTPDQARTTESEWSSFRGKAIDDRNGAATPRSVWFKGKLPAGEAPRHRLDGPPEPEPAQGAAPDAGLPKRQPRGNLMGGRPATNGVAPAKRDPNATRGFLSNYQTGIRQGVRDSGDQRSAQEDP